MHRFFNSTAKSQQQNVQFEELMETKNMLERVKCWLRISFLRISFKSIHDKLQNSILQNEQKYFCRANFGFLEFFIKPCTKHSTWVWRHLQNEICRESFDQEESKTSPKIIETRYYSLSKEEKSQRSLKILGFHDCVGTRCDGCINLGMAENKGLDVVVQKLDKIYDVLKFHQFASKADFYALAAILSAQQGFQNSVVQGKK